MTDPDDYGNDFSDVLQEQREEGHDADCRRPLPPAAPYAELKVAHAAGKVIQIESEPGLWTDIPKPTWAYPALCYRIKPDPQPWSSPDDVPGPVCWIRKCGDSSGLAWLLVCVCTNGFHISQSVRPPMIAWRETQNYEYSTDRKTWRPCVKE